MRYWSGTPDARAELKSLLQRSGTSLVGAHEGADEVAGLPLLSDMMASPVVAAPEAAAPAPASGASAVSPAPYQKPDQEPDQEEPEGPASAADQVTQAETLEQAARDGTPFCEICVASATAAQA